MMVPDVVHDEAPGQGGQREFGERWHPRLSGRRGKWRGQLGRWRDPLAFGRRRGSPGARVGQQSLPRAAVEHGLDVLPGVSHVVRGIARQLHVTSPRVEIGGVRLHVLVGGAMRVKDELVGRQEDPAVGALDALGPRTVVAGWQERAATAPRALVVNGEGKVLR